VPMAQVRRSSGAETDLHRRDLIGRVHGDRPLPAPDDLTPLVAIAHELRASQRISSASSHRGPSHWSRGW
jgi:hypothetical protein